MKKLLLLLLVAFALGDRSNSTAAGKNLRRAHGPVQIASFVVPNEPGKEIHIIREVTDHGTPPLVGYQRVFSNIK